MEEFKICVSDFDKVCRTCLTRNEYLSSIFSSNITELLMECTGVEVSFNDGLPSLICDTCIDNIYRTINFKRTCLNAQQALKKLLENSKHANKNVTPAVKEEETDENDFLDYSSADSNNGNNEIDVKNIPVKVEVRENNQIGEEQVLNSLKKKKKIICKECGRVCPSLSKLRRHQQIHQKPEDRFFYCRICEKTFLSPDNLKRHIKCFHEGEQQPKEVCSICGKSYSQLRTHMKVKHSDNKPHKCTKCNQQFSFKCILVKHIREKHEGVQQEKKALCMLCGKSFRTGGQLNAHQLTHSDKRKFECKICGKSYKLSGGLKYHMKGHNNKRPYLCSYCDKKFYTNSALRRHTRIHTGERPYCCTICNKSFNQQSILKTHMKVHSI